MLILKGVNMHIIQTCKAGFPVGRLNLPIIMMMEIW